MGTGQKRWRGGGELAQVAEMVMVLAAAGEARGGWDPTAAERALAAEAMGKLAAAVEEVAQPRELVPKEAVCALVEDLGLGRPCRASIAERVLLTKRKVSLRFSPLAGLYAVTRSPFPMEEVNESFVHSTTNMPKTTSSSAITGSQQGASKSTGSPWNLSNPVTAPIISNQPLLNGTIAGSSYVKPANIPSIASLLPVGSADIKVEKSVNGSRVTERGGNVTAVGIKFWLKPNGIVHHVWLRVAAENPTKKDCGKHAVANESATNQNFEDVGNTLHKSSARALDTTSSKSFSIYGSGPRKENVKHDETSFLEKERNGQPCGGMHTETAKPCNEGHSSGASTYSSSNLSGGSHIHTESSSVNSVEDSTLQSTAYSNHTSIVSSKENCGGKENSYQQSSKNVQMSSCTTPTDEIHQAHGLTNNGIKKAHEQEMLANDAISAQGNVQQVNLNGQIYPDCEIAGDPKDGFVGCSTSSIVDWIGDALKAVDNETYYTSCSIDGLIYNLHDNILIASGGSRASPCKLQTGFLIMLSFCSQCGKSMTLGLDWLWSLPISFARRFQNLSANHVLTKRMR
ncbi:hypothetical protein PR202_ga17072 [Eleusine coracana subsp. coracana]|uniref:DUF7797 domain-containing protein n=1 Tax=Eleusine coracana subsp. coracana TaxID=191504 RepID=A0AAV5CP90_ELECO|nr:hypothetical protein PR202_ga17072 [Eleusine coracana subsp. coracana]